MNGVSYSLRDRNNLLKIIRSIARSHDGRLGEAWMILHCSIELFKRWLCAYCPQTVLVMRKFKRFLLPKS